MLRMCQCIVKTEQKVKLKIRWNSIALTSWNILSNGSGSIILYCYRLRRQSLTDNNTIKTYFGLVEDKKNHSLQIFTEID